ncbi:transposable element Tcb2 transposase [Trichonephila clavipes]|nr:transposable element Tcb2 transposase [Trichonephila clavipes]
MATGSYLTPTYSRSQRFQEGDEEVETWMTCDTEDSGFQMLNDDEILTSCKKNPILLMRKRMKTSTTRTTKVWIREISFTRRPGLGYPRQTSRREDRYMVRNARVQPTASSAAIQTQVAPLSGAPASARTIRRRLAERHLVSQRSLHVLHLTPTHRRLRSEWCHARGKWTAAEWNQVVFSDESRFNLSSDDNCVRVWRRRVERLNPAFALQRHTAPTADVMACDVIAFNTRSPLVLIIGTITAQWYVHDILHPHVLPLMQRSARAIFQQDNVRPRTARLSQDCIRTVTTIPWSA